MSCSFHAVQDYLGHAALQLPSKQVAALEPPMMHRFHMLGSTLGDAAYHLPNMQVAALEPPMMRKTLCIV